MQMGMPMLGIHAKLEPLSIVYVSYHTFDHLSPFFEGFQETTCSQTELSGLPRHRTLNMIFLDILEMIPTFASQWALPIIDIHGMFEGKKYLK